MIGNMEWTRGSRDGGLVHWEGTQQVWELKEKWAALLICGHETACHMHPQQVWSVRKKSGWEGQMWESLLVEAGEWMALPGRIGRTTDTWQMLTGWMSGQVDTWVNDLAKTWDSLVFHSFPSDAAACENNGMVNRRALDFEGNTEFSWKVYKLVAMCLWASPLTSSALASSFQNGCNDTSLIRLQWILHKTARTEFQAQDLVCIPGTQEQLQTPASSSNKLWDTAGCLGEELKSDSEDVILADHRLSEGAPDRVNHLICS